MTSQAVATRAKAFGEPDCDSQIGDRVCLWFRKSPIDIGCRGLHFGGHDGQIDDPVMRAFMEKSIIGPTIREKAGIYSGRLERE
jgi:hypothetical protein